MQEVCRIISEHYGVKVTLADSSLNALTIGGMMENDNLDVLLRSLEATNDFKITRKDNEILISKP
jgi:ferric-dicitrate binding protein FerR (iron transport regulator)